MGSVKDISILEKASAEDYGKARFSFSNRYSVFDWGEMPDHLEHKGESIALLSAYFFEKLGSMGIHSHFSGLVEGDKVRKLSELKKPSGLMEVKLVRVIKPGLQGEKYDYSAYKKEKGGYLIPLEVIYRNYLPAGSSVFKRLQTGQLKPSELGLSKMPEPGQKLDKTIYDVSTKLEITDRYLSWQEAGEISALSAKEIEEVKKLCATVNDAITEEFGKQGLVNEDGKIEVALGYDRKLMLVDVIGTLDECRFSYQGFPVSKELARVHYRQTEWFRAVEEAKKQDRQNWKSKCRVAPEKLPPKLKKLIEQVYCACTNEITRIKWFKDTPPLKQVLKEIKTELPV